MKRLIVSTLAAGLVAIVGCETRSTPGGPGASRPDNRSITGAPKRDTFDIKVPTGTTRIKQGEQKEVDITVERGAELKQDVTVECTKDATGLTVTPAKHTIKASDADTKVRLTIAAAKDAAIGKDKVTVKASSESGAPTSKDFEVEVVGAK
jgi:uncharacterized membrane protein